MHASLWVIWMISMRMCELLLIVEPPSSRQHFLREFKMVGFDLISLFEFLLKLFFVSKRDSMALNSKIRRNANNNTIPRSKFRLNTIVWVLFLYSFLKSFKDVFGNFAHGKVTCPVIRQI
jgi:hypothetical protein